MPIMARTRARDYDPYSDWGLNSKGQQVNAMGQRKTIGFSPDRAPSRGFGGLNEHYIRQNYDGTPKAIDAAAQEARKAGVLIDRNGQRMADTWENRGFKTHLSDKNPYAQPAAPAAPAAPGLPPGPPSKENQDWANKPAPKGGRGGGAAPKGGGGGGGGGGGAAPAAPGGGGNDDTGSDEGAPAEETTGEEDEGSDGGGGEPAPQPEPEPEDSGLLKVELPTPNRALIPPTPPPMGNDNSGQAAPGYQGIADSGWGQSAAESAMQSKPSPQPVSNRVSSNPYQARADNVANAKADGSFGGIRDQYNKNNLMENAHWMDENGGISVDEDIARVINRSQLQPLADEIAARRDFARGEAPVMFTDPNESPTANEMNPQPRRAVKANPYGTATATFGSKPPTGGTMEDPLTGATVPIKQWTNDQSAVQATKYGPGAAQAGENYFGPKKTQGQVDANRYVDTAISAMPLGQHDAKQYRAIARGGKTPRSPKA